MQCINESMKSEIDLPRPESRSDVDPAAAPKTQKVEGPREFAVVRGPGLCPAQRIDLRTFEPSNNRILSTLRETTGAAPIRSRTSCAKPVQTYIKHVPKMLGSIPKSTKIVTRRVPKSMTIGGWMGLGPLFVVFGALGREFSGKLWARCAKLGQDGSKLCPRWATMASRWPSRCQLWRLWCHLGCNLSDFGRGLGRIWEAFWRMVGTCLLYTSPSPRDRTRSRMPSSA